MGLVIFDEFHERSIHADLGLALCLDIQHGLRQELRIMVMSATLEVARLAGVLGDAAVVIGRGRSYPIRIIYQPPAGKYPAGKPHNPGFSSTTLARRTAALVRKAYAEQQGDILVFLPGSGEIRAVESLLRAASELEQAAVRPLFGSLAKSVQEEAIRPSKGGRRRIVLATPIAETSLTIEGISTVVDSGWARTVRFNPNTGLSRLVPVRITKASAEQRAGRAGRLGPGYCYRLWDAFQQQTLQDHPEPEILEADLAPLALELTNWGAGPEALTWLDPPPAKHYAQALALLHSLGAVDGHGRITEAGRRMAELPVHPRLAHMLLASEKLALANLACLLAALLEERDVLHYRAEGQTVDLGYRLHVLEAFLAGKREGVRQFGGDPAALERVVAAARRLAEVVGRGGKKKSLPERAAARLLSFAYPDRIAMLRENSRSRYLLANGRGVTLAETDSLAGSPFLAVARLDAGQVEGRLQLAARLEEEDLLFDHRERMSLQQSVLWDEQRQAVSAVEELRFDALVLKKRPLAKADPEKVATVLLEKIRASNLLLLPWSERVRQLQARVICLAAWHPAEAWPPMTDTDLAASLEQWLRPYLDGIGNAAQLQRLDLGQILKNRLSWHQQQRLEELAPEQLTVPSGSRKKLRYTAGEPPVLAVRLQEMFGLGDTPLICGGRIAVILHLLSPAQRPLQVTRDLRGFWDRTYPEIRKELKGRYPRHHWPEDPWQARPTGRAKPRKS